MKSTSFIAKRYLFSKKHVSLISTLTMISIVGVTIGTALLIVVLSVFNGFFSVIKSFLLKNEPDIRIESAEANSFVFTNGMRNDLKNIPQITAFAPFTEDRAMLAQKGNHNEVVRVKGIPPQQYLKVSNLRKSVNLGNEDLSFHNGKAGMLVSQKLMQKAHLQIGDQVVLLSAKGMQKSLTQFALPHHFRFEIRGAYSRLEIAKGPAVFIDEKAGQRLFKLRNKATGIDVKLQHTEQATQVKEKLGTKLGNKYKISTWYNLQQPLYDVMYLEKWSSYFILMIIVLVAVLNIIGSLTMIVIQKNRDIGVLLTMGFTSSDIKSIFIRQGIYIGLIGCGLGGGIGLLLSWLQQQFGLIKLSSAFIINAYPISIDSFDVVIVLTGSMLLCVLASWYPSQRASKVKPAGAIRYD